MPVELNRIPAPARRPEKPVSRRWLKWLMGLIIVGSLFSWFSGQLTRSPGFWLFAIVLPASLWLIAAWARGMIYFLGHIQANAWDRSREELILKEVRRGRRALQILQGTFITAHTSIRKRFCVPSSEALVQNKNALRTQNDWKGNSVRHSRLTVSPDTSPETFLSQIFADLLPELAVSLNQYPDDQRVALLFESDTSLSRERVRDLWHAAWQQSDIRQSPEEIDAHGLAAIDHWLDSRIKENTLLLVIALQVATASPENTGEAVAALLLGNRMTQNVLMPYALMHRPEPGKPQTLATNITQALDWKPLLPEDLHHLWQAGLSEDGRQAVSDLNGKPPLRGVAMNSTQYDLDNTLGHTGCVAPWLAIAAAALVVQEMQEDHLVVSGEQGDEMMWSTVVSPYQSVKEKMK